MPETINCWRTGVSLVVAFVYNVTSSCCQWIFVSIELIQIAGSELKKKKTKT